MKKQIVTACALVASVAAFATSVASENTFGILKYEVSSSSDGQVMVGVPWLEVGGGDVSPTNLILSANRVAGDMMYWYDSSTSIYKAWKIEADGGSWSNTGTWEISESGATKEKATGTETAARGNVIILSLNKKDDAYPDVFLYGQYATTGAASNSLVCPETSGSHKVVCNLVAPSMAANVNLQTAYTSGVVFRSGESAANADTLVGDSILLPDGTTFVFVKESTTVLDGETSNFVSSAYTGWTKKALLDPSKELSTTNPYVYWNVACELTAGQGAWYFRKGASPLTIVW